MKTCSKCKEKKELNNFYKNSFKKDGHQDLCIECKKNQDKKHWDKHKIKWNKHYLKVQKERLEYFNAFKEAEKCKKCNENRYWLLDFHHIDPKLKTNLVKNMGSLKTAKTEIEKCIVLCSNCHRDFHYQERNSNMTIKEYLNAPVG